LESSSPARSHFKAGDPPPLLGEHPPFIVSFTLPLAAVILAGMLNFSFTLQASIISPL
jgi:hypothetical protein